MDSFSIAFRRSDQVLLRNILFGVTTIGAGAIFSLLARQSIYIISGWVLAGFGACILGGVQLWKTLSRYQLSLAPGLGHRGRADHHGAAELSADAERTGAQWVLPILVTELISPADNARWYAVWMTAWVVYRSPSRWGRTCSRM